MLDMLNILVSNQYNQHVPVVTKRITKRFSVSWMTKDILSHMACRDFFVSQSKKVCRLVTDQCS